MDQDNLNVQGEEACEVENDIIDGKIESDDTSNTETDVEVNSEGTDDEKLIAANHKANEYLDKLQRTMAEYDNFRKRTIKEKTQMYDMGVREVFEKILPIVDNFERAFENTTVDDMDKSFQQGIVMIYNQLLGVMKEMQVEEIDALGKEFDPNLHHAVFHEDNDEYGKNEVIEVLQKGYMCKDKVLRFSMVKVVN